MAVFDVSMITEQGAALLQATQSSGTVLEFTKIEAGDGQYTEDEDLSGATALRSKRLEASVTSAVRASGGAWKVSAVLTNEELARGCYVQEVGLYARDPEVGDILFCISVCYTQSEADYLAPYDGNVVLSVSETTYIKLSAATQVIIQSETNYASAADLEALAAQVTANGAKITEMRSNGIGDGTQNLWDNSINLMTLAGSMNGGIHFVEGVADELISCPISGSEVFRAYRRQGTYKSGNLLDYAYVELVEVTPVNGRHWERLYNRQDGGWGLWRRTDSLENQKQTGTVTTDIGLRLTWTIIPSMGILQVMISGEMTRTIPTMASYYDLATVPEIAAIITGSQLKYILYGYIFRGQLRVETDGRIRFGYTRMVSDNSAGDLPSGMPVFINEVFMIN